MIESTFMQPGPRSLCYKYDCGTLHTELAARAAEHGSVKAPAEVFDLMMEN
jgi:hypothetical protein